MSPRAVGLDGLVRANPDYCLRSWGSLAPRTRARLSAVAAPADGDAVLVGRRGSMLPAKLVNASAARLFSSLRRRPRPALDALAEDQLICLILDSALQVELGFRWAGGPLAYEAMFPEAILPDPADRLGRISYDAGPLGEPAERWRLSVCRRLAESLAAAKRAPLRQLPPERYALGRLALDGVLLPSFAPSSVPTPSGLSAADAVSS